MHTVKDPSGGSVSALPRRWRSRRHVTALFACWWLTLSVGGCYRYVPVTVSAPEPGRRVSLELTDAGSSAVAGLLGPRTRSVEGDLGGRNDSSLVLAVRIVRRDNGVEDYWRGEQVAVPAQAVSRVAERKFSRMRTSLVAGLAVVGAVALGALLGDQLGSSGDVSTGPGRPR